MFVPIILFTAMFCFHSLEGKNIPQAKRLPCSTHLRNHIQRDAVTDPNLQWPKATVYFKIDPDYTTEENALIRESFHQIEDVTCIRFKERRREKDYVFVSPNGKVKGCYAVLGRYGGKQALNLLQDGCMTEDTIIHEAIHSLGFEHEHQRPDRDDYIDVIWDNLMDGRNDTSFTTYSYSEMDTQDLPYDYASIMHYQWNDNAKNDKKPTMVSKDPHYDLREYRHDEMTQLDIDRINMVYC